MKNLPWSILELEIVDFFADFKIVEAVKIGVQADGKKSGNAMVCFENEEECERAKHEKANRKLGDRWVNLFTSDYKEFCKYMEQ